MANIPGTSGADNLVGTSSADTLDGGAGNDTLNGGYGDDTYLFGRGDGHDVIVSFNESATNKLNTLQFKAGVLPSEVVVVRNGSDLIVSIIGTADQVTVDEFFYSYNNPSNSLNPVQEFRFSNGTVWNLDAIRAKAFIGTTGADNLDGTVLADTLDGGAGNDTLNGGFGDDTYLFGKGDGHDVIVSFNESATNKLNTLQFKAGVLPSEVVVVRNGSDLIVSIIGTADQVTVDEFFSSYNNPSNSLNPVQEFRFSNGTVWNLSAIESRVNVGAGSNDVLIGESGADVIYGGGGNDYLYMGDGIDTAYGDAGIDVLLLDAGNDVGYGGADQDYLFGGAGNDALHGEGGVDVPNGETGDDTIYGGDGGDYVYGGIGNDAAYGEAGNDIFVMEAGNDSADGGVGQDYFYMGDGDDFAYGGDGVDVFLGGAGNDRFEGGAAVDYAWGGAGNDSFVVRASSGVMVVQDFTAGGTEDQVRFAADTGLRSLSKVQAASTYYAGMNTTIVTVDADTAIWLVGVNVTQLTAGDFVFF